MENEDTNTEIARLILDQTYEQRVELAAYLASATQSGIDDGWESSVFDLTYYAELLAGWAKAKEGEKE